MQAQAPRRSCAVADDEKDFLDNHYCLAEQQATAATTVDEDDACLKKKVDDDNYNSNDDVEDEGYRSGSVESAVEDGADSSDEGGATDIKAQLQQPEIPVEADEGTPVPTKVDDGEEWVDFSVDDGEVVDGEKVGPVRTVTSARTMPSSKKTSWVWRPKKKMSKAQRVIMQHYSARSELIRKKREMMNQSSDGAGPGAAASAPGAHAESPIKNLKVVHATVTRWMLREYAAKAVARVAAQSVAEGGATKELVVLDVACGRGGDVAKWEEMVKDEDVLLEKVDYVGVDVVEGLIEEAKKRRFMDSNVTARFLCEDAYGGHMQEIVRNLVSKSRELQQRDEATIASKEEKENKEEHKEGIFDICSCQFALHYAWSSEERARTAMRDIAALLKVGGYFIGSVPDAEAIVAKLGTVAEEHPLHEHLTTTTTTHNTSPPHSPCSPPTKFSFGNSVYRLSFDLANTRRALAARVVHPSIPSSNISSFSPSPFGIQYDVFLADAVLDCPEWLVPLPALQRLGLDYGLQLVFASNFDHFCLQHQHHHPHQPLFLEYPTPLPLDLECNCLYLMFAFQKL